MKQRPTAPSWVNKTPSIRQQRGLSWRHSRVLKVETYTAAKTKEKVMESRESERCREVGLTALHRILRQEMTDVPAFISNSKVKVGIALTYKTHWSQQYLSWQGCFSEKKYPKTLPENYEENVRRWKKVLLPMYQPFEKEMSQ